MTLVSAVQGLFQVLYVLLLIRVVLSWVPGAHYDHPAVRFVYRVTSPMLDPIRRVLPPIAGLDLSPMIAIMVLSVLQRAITDLAFRAALL